MGQSTNGIICFGVPCEEGTEFPWDDEGFDGDIVEWWRAINGFTDIHSPFTALGDYSPGWSRDDPRLTEYYEHRARWLAEHPVPVELENYCSGDYPMYAITVPWLGMRCYRGYPETFDPRSLVATDRQVEDLKAFMVKHGINGDGEPRWLLISYWG